MGVADSAPTAIPDIHELVGATGTAGELEHFNLTVADCDSLLGAVERRGITSPSARVPPAANDDHVGS